jgi:sugar transferase (PEP-CTERM/EpsH1 system associated)
MTQPKPGQIHVLHILLSLEPGGLENGVVNVINGLDENDFFSSVCCLQRTGEFAERIRVPSIVFQMGHTKGNDFFLPVRLAWRIRQLRPDIVHTRNPEAFFYGFVAAKLAGVKVIVHSEHGRSFPETPLRRRVQKLFSAYTDQIFALTNDLRKDLIEHISIPSSKIEVIPNGVDLGRFQSGDRHVIRRQLGIGDKIVIGSVGRLVPIKNYALLIRSMSRLREQFDLAAVFIGDGPERARLEALAHELGLKNQVYFLGHQKKVYELLAGLDIFVLPSFNEGMSNTLIEALAAGVSCVASDVGGNPEIIRDRLDGLLCRSGDVDSLTACLAALCEDKDLRERLAVTGRERVKSMFGLDRMIERYEQLYRRVYRRQGPITHASSADQGKS